MSPQNVIKCPACGENNLADQEFCQYCQTRLHPLTGKLKGADAPLQPGELPTKKNTAELEPVLPQWLREARNTARQTFEDDITKEPEQPVSPPRPNSYGSDLLAGLQAQSQDDEEETPDWLANITGEAPKKKKSQPESSEVRWVELGGTNDFPQSSPEADDSPAWLQGLASSTPQPGEKDELSDWLHQADTSRNQVQQPDQPLPQQSQPSPRPSSDPLDNDVPDWLRSMADEGSDLSKSGQPSVSPQADAPDWLRTNNAGKVPPQSSGKSGVPSSQAPSWLHTGELGSKAPVNEPASSDADVPDWLRTMDTGNASAPSADVPDWLRTMDAGSGSIPESPKAPDTSAAFSETPDWLRGLDSGQGAESAPAASFDADTPDWLRGMDAGQDAPSAPTSISSDADTPDWLRGLDSGQSAATPIASSDADTPDWMRGLDSGQNASAPIVSDDADTPDWLRGMDTGQNNNELINSLSSPDAESPDWMRRLDSGQSTPPAASDFETPDWLRGLDSGQGAAAPAGVPSDSETPDWLSGMDTGQNNNALINDLGSADVDTPDWMRGIDSGQNAAPATEDSQDWLKSFDASGTSPDLDWMKGIDSGSQPAQEATPAAAGSDTSEEDVPSWLKAAAPQSPIFEDTSPAQQGTPTPAAASSDFDTPDWLNSFTPADTSQASAPVASTAGGQPDTGSGDSLFTEMPDWLSDAVESPSPESTPAQNADDIAPSELPSWVQAMRPVGTGISQTPSTSLSGDATIESRGALAGLQGVLPAVQGFAPTSKPKAYSIKLRASEEQQAHAALLEQILAAETSPVPIGSTFVLAPSRVLRAILTLFLFVGLVVVIALGLSTFSMPVGLPIETGDALNVIRSIPEGAPVLVIFDYDPARVGEMEAAAVPVFDQMMLLRHPRMAFISTSETGAILAERFISGPLAGYNYQSGDQYLNLGYLPSGEMGIRAFVQDPRDTASYAITANPPLFDMSKLVVPAWQSEPWNGITSLSQFAAFIVITDNAESSRAWIEQTTAAPDVIPNIPVVVISSAQAAPMIQPYYNSKQINGLVSGLYGGALVEQNNVGRPGTARAYWDAYSIGIWLAVVLILGGGLLNLILGLRDRNAARRGK